MSEFTVLLDEFKQLKSEIFAQGDFVVIEDPDSVKMQRYNQLLGFFYPQFRTTDWKSPV
jgi:hypothetical protein